MKTVIGVMGASQASVEDIALAETLGQAIAAEGWVTLSGGHAVGVMEAVSKGAHEAGSLTVGVTTKADTSAMSTFVDVPVVTGMGSARNNINVLSSDVVVVCGMLSIGTLSEVCLALSAGKPVILLGEESTLKSEVAKLAPAQVQSAASVTEVIEQITSILS